MSEEVRVFSLPDEYLVGIGRVVTSFAALEDAIKVATHALIDKGGSGTGYVITSEMSFRNIVALFSSLFRLKTSDATALAEMESIISSAMTVEGKRNQIVHSTWGVRPWNDGRVEIIRKKTTAKVSKGFRRQEEVLTTEYLHELVSEIINATKAWTDFLYKHLMPDSPVEPPYGDAPWTHVSK